MAHTIREMTAFTSQMIALPTLWTPDTAKTERPTLFEALLADVARLAKRP
jgi:hypothetical protein